MDSEKVLERLASIVGPGYATDDPGELWCYTGNLLPTSPQFVVRPGTVAAVPAEAGVAMAERANRLAPKGLRVIEGSVAPYCATVGALTGVGPGLRKYGRREQQILDIEVVLSTGEVIH